MQIFSLSLSLSFFYLLRYISLNFSLSTCSILLLLSADLLFLLTHGFSASPLHVSTRLWPAVASKGDKTLQFGSAQLNDSASESVFQILGRVSDQPSLGQMSILGSVTETGGVQSRGT